VGPIAALFLFNAASSWSQSSTYQFNDSHFHLTNNIPEGPGIRDFLGMMGDKAGRAILSGIPLQQEWSYRKEQQARFDPMITGFNPADMYAADHVRRVLETFPGVFTGIGEFSIHKEFVSGKIPGEVASLQNPALDRLLDFAGQVGLVVLIHNDIDVPFAKEGTEPAYLGEMKALFKRHRNATIIWAHMGLGRTVRPGKNHATQIEEILKDPNFDHVYFDLAWDEVAKYFVGSPEATGAFAALIQRYPDRFLFGSDAVAPADQSKYLMVFNQYQPLWNTLDAKTSRKVRLENYERIFDEGRRKVRTWESNHLPAAKSDMAK
jgi:Amidohydrolase